MTGTAADVEAELRAALGAAMRAGDRTATRALRTGLSAIANAAAPAISSAPLDAGRGLGAGEVARLALTDLDARRTLADEVADRRATAAQLRQHGEADEAAVLDAEADVLDRHT